MARLIFPLFPEMATKNRADLTENQELALLDGLKLLATPEEREEARNILARFDFVPKTAQNKKAGLPQKGKTNRIQEKEREVTRDIAYLIGSAEKHRGASWKILAEGLAILKGFHKECLEGLFLSPQMAYDLTSLAVHRTELKPILRSCLKTLHETGGVAAKEYFAKFPPPSPAFKTNRTHDGVKSMAKEIDEYFGIPSKPRNLAHEKLLRHLMHCWLVIDRSRYIHVKDLGSAYTWTSPTFRKSRSFLGRPAFRELATFLQSVKWHQRLVPSVFEFDEYKTLTPEAIQKKLQNYLESDAPAPSREKVERIFSRIKSYQSGRGSKPNECVTGADESETGKVHR